MRLMTYKQMSSQLHYINLMADFFQETMLNGVSPHSRASDSAWICVRREYPSNSGYLRALKHKADAGKDNTGQDADHKVVCSHGNDNDDDLYSVKTCLCKYGNEGPAVKYSRWCTLPHVSTNASRIKSKPRKKISAPTTMIGMNPINTGPITSTPNVARANRTPATRLSPPLRMNSIVLV